MSRGHFTRNANKMETLEVALFGELDFLAGNIVSQR